MKRLPRRAIAALCMGAGVAFMAMPGRAQTLVDPVGRAEAGMFETSGALSLSTMDFKKKGDRGGPLDRVILGATAAYGFGDYLDVYGCVGYAVRSEPWRGRTGDGFLFSAGLRSLALRLEPFSLHTLAEMRHLAESYGGGDSTVSELVLGGAVRMDIGAQAGVYAAAELIPISDGDLDARSAGEFDIERRTPFVLKLGGRYDMGELLLRAELALLGEQSLLVGVATRF